MIELVFDHELTPTEVAELEALHGPALRYKGGKNAGELKVTSANIPDYTKPKGRVVKRQWEFPASRSPLKNGPAALTGCTL